MKIAAALATALLLCACSREDDSFRAPPTPESVASQIGCTGFQKVTTRPLFVHDAGRCRIGSDSEVLVLTFNDSIGRAAFIRNVQTSGSSYAFGDRFAIQASPATLARLEGKHGIHRL